MPSYLGKYKNAASNRDTKLPRAIRSVLNQNADLELVIVADGCDQTIEIVRDNFTDERIRMFKVSDDRNFGAKRNAGASGYPRNAGIQQAKGEYIIYLDIDDTYREGYLEDLSEAMTDYDWYWFHDLSWDRKTEQFNKHICNIDVQGQCGTSNLCHRRSMGLQWNEKSYLHDWIFISSLKRVSQNYKFLDVVGYQICHVPHLLDV